MKNFTKFLTIVVIGLAFCFNSHAQVSTTASASATIVTALTITKVTDLSFGRFAVNAAGTVTVGTDNSRSQTAGCALFGGGAVTAASFSVTGEPSRTYTISIVTPVTLTHTVTPANNLVINTFVTNPVSPATLAAGANTLLVGATLNADGSEIAGDYTGTFTVSLNYN